MAAIGERQVSGGNGKGHQAKKGGYPLVMEGFWSGDKCRNRAALSSHQLSKMLH